MQSIIVMQECTQCGKMFPLRYFEDGTFEYVSDTCDCEADFEPVSGKPSISEWLETLNCKMEEMIYPQTIYNQNGGKVTFVEAFQKGIAKYLDTDGETILFLTCFNNNKCVELFDGKITENQFTY